MSNYNELECALQYAQDNRHGETARLLMSLAGGDGITLESLPAENVEGLTARLLALPEDPQRRAGQQAEARVTTASRSVRSRLNHMARSLFGKPTNVPKPARALDSKAIFERWNKHQFVKK